jgi:Ca2+-binding RTX toxin-like protein
MYRVLALGLIVALLSSLAVVTPAAALVGCSVRGTRGGDRIQGGAGDEWIRGSNSRDTVEGGPGDDLLEGGARWRSPGSAGFNLAIGAVGQR